MYAHRCKTCDIAYKEIRRKQVRESVRLWQQKHPEADKAAKKEWYETQARHRSLGYQRLRVYGITEQEYLSRLQSQNGVCAICKGPGTARNVRGELRPLHVDHDHVTKEIRGLLCHACNMGLGFFRDDPERLTAAIGYLMPSGS